MMLADFAICSVIFSVLAWVSVILNVYSSSLYPEECGTRVSMCMCVGNSYEPFGNAYMHNQSPKCFLFHVEGCMLDYDVGILNLQSLVCMIAHVF